MIRLQTTISMEQKSSELSYESLQENSFVFFGNDIFVSSTFELTFMNF